MFIPIIYSAINATVFDYAGNSKRIVQAMEDAEKQQDSVNANYHIMSAMPLTGPHAQANISYLSTAQNNTDPLRLLQRIATEGSPIDSTLTTCISFPWYHREVTQDVNHPFYYDETNEMNNRPFYATAFIRGGKIIGINMESHLEYTDGGPYDDRYYAKWPMSENLNMTLPGDDASIPVGAFLGTENQFCTASNLTKAQALLRLNPELKTIFIHGSNSILPADIQRLSTAFPKCQLIAGMPLGSDSGDKCGSGAVVFCQEGNLQHLTDQLSPSYYSFAPTLTQVIDLSQGLSNERLNPHLDMVKASALWMRDYLLKSKQQGFVISMTEGFHSAYSLMIANFSIDWAIDSCGGLENYLASNYFGFLACKDAVLDCLKTSSDAMARQLLKHNMLTCVFAPQSLTQSQTERERMSELAHAIGAKFQASEVGKILDANYKALRSGLADAVSQKKLDSLFSENEHQTAAIERAQVTHAGMFGNLENKICVSNASATNIALDELHSGGAGQEGPISVTLALFDSQIAGALNDIKSAVHASISQLLQKIPAPDPGLSLVERIVDQLILQKKSPIATYRHLKEDEPIANHQKLREAIDWVCKTWSSGQPSRVALSVAPHLEPYGKNLDRYRSVRNSRDNQYFNNGRMELKLDFMGINDAHEIMIAQSCPAVLDYLQSTSYMDLEKEKCIQLIKDYSNNNQIKPRKPTVLNASATAAEASFNLHVGVASLHQTMFDYAKNKKNIKDAIQDAIDAGVDVLLMPELCLTGYFGDGDFDWINNQEEGNKILQHALDIANFARHSPMVISIGLPVFIVGHEKPFVGQALLQAGKIISISFKTAQPDGDAEYEAMHFKPFDPQHGNFTMSVDGQDDPIVVGKPVVLIRDQYGHEVPIYQEQCAEAWAGVNNDGTVNHAIQLSKRRLNQIAIQHSNLLVLNPSGSKNDVSFPKTLIRQSCLGQLALALNPKMAGYIYGNVAGDDNGYVGGDSDTYVLGKGADGQPKLHQGQRHTLAERTLTSMVIPVAAREQSSSSLSDVTLIMTDKAFNPFGHLIGPICGAPAAFDRQQSMETAKREYTETILASSSWVLNTLRHHKKQCFVISLSGGADSALGAVQVVTAVDLFIQEHTQKAQADGKSTEDAQRFAVRELFNENLSHLHCKKDVLETCEKDGVATAIKLIKKNILVCVYTPTANSSKDTELSAKTLIEGGPRYRLDNDGRFIKPLQKIEGPDCEGLGGEFLVANLQETLEEYILQFAAKKDDFGQQLNNQDVIEAIEQLKKDWPNELGHINHNEALLDKIIVLYSEGRLYDKAQLTKPALPQVLVGLLQQLPPTWFERSHDLTKQNLQPRLRSICPWLLAALRDGLPLFTSNLSEAAAGYSTWAGDTSLGYENPLGGILKSDVRRMLLMFEQGELCGLSAIRSLFYVNHLEPSAELRPLNEKGEYAQTDEADLMPYTNLDRIIKVMLLCKKTPWQTYEILKDACDHLNQPLFKSDEERAAQIHKVCWLYQASQFKRTGGGNTPFLGRNLDPHLSQATPLHSLCLTNLRVEMNLKIIGQYDNLYDQALLDSELRYLVVSTPLSHLQKIISTWHEKNQNSKISSVSFFNPNKQKYNINKNENEGEFKNKDGMQNKHHHH